MVNLMPLKILANKFHEILLYLFQQHVHLQAKIYYYEDFMLPAGGISCTAAGPASVGPAGGAACMPGSGAAQPVAGGGAAPADNSAAGGTDPTPKRKPKVKGGHLRNLINYSDRF